ncbi:hypothetical protein K1719_014590 [Acacia pycnantha]|nr:hypothetical protein K1719_014590 [Acacia pycnantha]
MKLILIGFLYLSYVGDPKTLWKWFEPYVKDDELLIVRCLIWYSWTKINLLIGLEQTCQDFSTFFFTFIVHVVRI